MSSEFGAGSSNTLVPEKAVGVKSEPKPSGVMTPQH